MIAVASVPPGKSSHCLGPTCLPTSRGIPMCNATRRCPCAAIAVFSFVSVFSASIDTKAKDAALAIADSGATWYDGSARTTS